jgi:hypothetical protein
MEKKAVRFNVAGQSMVCRIRYCQKSCRKKEFTNIVQPVLPLKYLIFVSNNRLLIFFATEKPEYVFLAAAKVGGNSCQ